MNLVPAIKAIQAEMDKLLKEYRETVKPYEDSLTQLRKLNTACENCGGSGKVLRHRACAEDDRPDPNDPKDYVKCQLCGGTGEANYLFLDEAKPEETATVKGTCSNCEYHGTTVYGGPSSYSVAYYCLSEKEPSEVEPTHSCEHWKPEVNDWEDREAVYQ